MERRITLDKKPHLSLVFELRQKACKKLKTVSGSLSKRERIAIPRFSGNFSKKKSNGQCGYNIIN